MNRDNRSQENLQALKAVFVETLPDKLRKFHFDDKPAQTELSTIQPQLPPNSSHLS